VTAPNDVQVQLGDGTRVARLLEPAASFSVIRLNRDLGDNAHVAIMATAVTHAETTERYALLAPAAGYSGTQELCPNPVLLTPLQQTNLQLAPMARCFSDAYVGSLDWRWRSPGGDYAIGGQLAASVLEKGPPRSVADGTVVHPGDAGWGARAYVNKEGGAHWVGDILADVESHEFAIDDLGYNERANQISPSGEVEYRELKPFGSFLEAHAFAHYGTTYDFEGLLVGQGLYVGSWGRFKNRWSYGTDFHYRGTKFDDREVGDGTALQRAGRFGHEIEVDTDPTARVSGGVDQIVDLIYDGFNMNGNARLSVRVLPQFDFDLLPNWQWTAGEPRFVSTGDVPGQYLFGRLDAKSVGVTIRTTYTFTPRLTLQGYAQLFLASGHYDQFTEFQSDPAGRRPAIRIDDLTPLAGRPSSNPDFEEGILNVNVVLRWEYMLGSTFYLVYTRAQVPTTVLGSTDVGTLNLAAVGRAPTSDALLAKLSFWWGGDRLTIRR
jgi:hypothetical protein